MIQRPYEDGKNQAYYRELYAVNRESKIDSLKELRPKYKTRAGRTIYGGGGITPDIYSEMDMDFTKSTREILTHPDRLTFKYAGELKTTIQKNKFKVLLKLPIE